MCYVLLGVMCYYVSYKKILNFMYLCVCLYVCVVLLESVKVPCGMLCVSVSLSSSLPPIACSNETLSSALRSRCMSSSPCGEEKLRPASAARAKALCLSPHPSLSNSRPA